MAQASDSRARRDDITGSGYDARYALLSPDARPPVGDIATSLERTRLVPVPAAVRAYLLARPDADDLADLLPPVALVAQRQASAAATAAATATATATGFGTTTAAGGEPAQSVAAHPSQPAPVLSSSSPSAQPAPPPAALRRVEGRAQVDKRPLDRFSVDFTARPALAPARPLAADATESYAAWRRAHRRPAAKKKKKKRRKSKGGATDEAANDDGAEDADEAALAALPAGPMSVLGSLFRRRARVNVYVRRAAALRGVVTGYLRAFDKHCNMLLQDVDEHYTTWAWPDGAAGDDADDARVCLVVRERHVGQLLVRGDAVVSVAEAQTGDAARHKDLLHWVCRQWGCRMPRAGDA